MEILVPISLGELYDKITILQIKLDRIKDEEKLVNIRHELDLLLKIAEKYPVKELQYTHELFTTNSTLWAVEDNLRKLEVLKQYDDTFINLAKRVYYLNDLRAKIKKDINLKYGSNIIEEKQYVKYD